MRRSKSIGFGIIFLASLFMIGAAVLPVSPATQRFGPFQVDIRGDNCGPAGYVLYDDANPVCTQAAQKRLVATSGVGLLIMALGMALFAGGDAPHGTRIQVGPPKVSRRSALRSPGSRRCTPG